MSVHAWQSTLTTTPEVVVPSTGIDANLPRFVHIAAASAAIRIGGDATVDNTDGFPFSDASSPMVVALQPGDALWMRSEATTATVQVLVTRSDAPSE